MNKKRLKLLTALLTQPTAPFREQHVIGFVSAALSKSRVPWFQDNFGNLVIGVPSERAYRRLLSKKAADPIRLFIAHMDHPGFHGLAWRTPSRLSVQWHGGSPIKRLSGAAVWLADDQGWTGQGRLTKVKLLPGRHALAEAEVVLTQASGPPPKASALYGGFRFRAPVWQQGKRLYTKAADDLVGVYAVLVTALEHKRRQRQKGPFIGLLTRAEEVGFVGAIAHFKHQRLASARRPVVAISLETSRTLPKAVIGGGPVVRLGDRRTVFDPDCLKVLADAAQRTLPGSHQRRIMDGGTCEATAATAFGIPAIGISVPLGNYHNEGFEGGPDCRGPRGPAPEFVHLGDIEGMITLCRALIAQPLPWSDPWADQRRTLQQRLAKYRNSL